jgi:hypothetical protein
MHCRTTAWRVLIGVIALLLFACAVDPYGKISVGDSLATVISLLGEPSNPDKELSSKEQESIKSALQKVNNRDSAYFSIWRRDVDFVYVIGFNKADKVVVKHKMLILNK